jgi:nucleolar complex protein 2
VKVFISNGIRLLKDLVDAEMIAFIMQELHHCADFIILFPKASKDYFRILLSTWGNALDDTLRVKAFAHARYLAVTHPKRYLGPLLKGCYLMFVKVSKKTTALTLPKIAVLKGCVIDAYGIDETNAYQHAFVYIRQLAVHLRTALSTRTKESFKQVYHWQFIHSLKVWSSILVAYAGNPAAASKSNKNQLQALVYPLVQIHLAVLRLVPTIHFYPLHLQVLESLTDLVDACGIHVPLATSYLSMLESLSRTKLKPSTLRPLFLSAFLRAPKQYAGTKVYITGLRQAVTHGFLRYLATISANIAFPELTIPVERGLRTVVKCANDARDATLSRSLQAILDTLKVSRQEIIRIRTSLDISPSDFEGIASFSARVDSKTTPLGKYWEKMDRIERSRLATVQESFSDKENDTGSQNKNKKNSKKSRNDSDDDSDADDSELDISTSLRGKPMKSSKTKMSSNQNVNQSFGPQDNPEDDSDDMDDQFAEFQGMALVMDDDEDDE